MVVKCNTVKKNVAQCHTGNYFGYVKESKNKRSSPLSLRLTPELESRLTTCAEKVKMPKNAIGQAAIEAAVEAIERNGYRLVMPMEFLAAHEAVAVQSESSPKSSAPSVKPGQRTAPTADSSSSIELFPKQHIKPAKVAEDQGNGTEDASAPNPITYPSGPRRKKNTPPT